MAQMKEQIKTPEKGLNEMEISNLSDAEFKTPVARMLKELKSLLLNVNYFIITILHYLLTSFLNLLFFPCP